MILIRAGDLTYGVRLVSDNTLEIKASKGPPYNWFEERLMLPREVTFLEGVENMLRWGNTLTSEG